MTVALITISLVALLALGGLAWVVWRMSAKDSNPDPVMGQSLDTILRDTRDLRVDQKLIREANQHLDHDLKSLADVLQQFKIRQEERNQREEEYTSSIKDSIVSIEHLFKGSKSKGMAGENILREIFKIFPPELIVFDYKVEGKPVEFGLKLPDGRIVPMDSKVVALEEMGQLATEGNEEVRQRLIKKIEADIRQSDAVTRRTNAQAEDIEINNSMRAPCKS